MYSMERETLKSLLEDGLSTREIAVQLGMSQTNVQHHIVQLGLSTERKKSRKRRSDSSRIWTSTDVEFSELIRTSNSISEVLRKLGLPHAGIYGSSVKDRAAKQEIPLTHFNKSIGHRRVPTDSMLIESSPYYRFTIKRRILQDKLIENVCCICRIGPSWNGEVLVLQLDHINGKSDDYRIENLRILCPNCHSQTQTFTGRNIKQARLVQLVEASVSKTEC